MELMELDIEDVIIGERFRIEYNLDEEFLDSIREKGIIQPITVTQNLELVTGGRRLAAAKELGATSISVVVRQTEDELDLRECEFIENVYRKDFRWTERNASINRIHKLMIDKHGEKNWSLRKTAQLLDKSVGGISRSLEMHKAVSSFAKLGECKTEDEAVKTLRQAKEKLAVQIMVGEHKERVRASDEEIEQSGDSEELTKKRSDNYALHAEHHFRIGDAFEGMQEMLDNDLHPPISFVEVDPPYGINLKGVKKGESRALDRYEEISAGKYPAFIKQLCESLYSVTPENTRICFWFGIEWYVTVRNNLEKVGFKVDPIPCIWTKKAGQTNAPDLYLARAWEPFFIATKGEGTPIAKRGRINVFDFPVVPAARKYHPTERPVELMREILRTFAWPRSIILVPFLGSGATLRAAYQENMTGFGWELNEENKSPFLAAVESDLQTAE